jgi:hypothetical protein
VLSALLVVPAYAVAVTAPGAADEGCPSPRQVVDALAARLPDVAQPVGQPPAPGALRLSVVAPGGAAAGLRVELSDANGEPVLHRQLPPPPARGKSPDCPALAETVALIVDRYLHEVGYEAPPSPPPPPPAPPPSPPTVIARPPPPAGAGGAGAGAAGGARRVWQIGLGASARAGDAGGLDAAGMIAAGVSGRRLGAHLSFGLAPAAYARWSDGHATLRRLPARLSLDMSLVAGPGRLEPGIAAGADLLIASFSDTGGDGSHTRVSPSGGVTVGYMLPLARHLYLRALALGAIAVPYRFVNTSEVEVWRTPRTYLELGVESGFSFP